MITQNEIEFYKQTDPFIKNLLTKNQMGEIVFRTNGGCNMGCTYCYQTLNKQNYTLGKKDIPYLIERVNRFFKERKEKYGNDKELYTKFSFIGGEISIHDELIDVFRAIRDNVKTNERIIWNAITNGYTITDNFRNFLKEINQLEFYLCVSLDVQKFHDEQRIDLKGKPTFDKILENIKEFKNMGIYLRRNIVISEKCFEMSGKEFFNEIKKHEDYFDTSNILLEEDMRCKETISEEAKKFFKEFLEANFKNMKECLEQNKQCKIKVAYCDLECFGYSMFYQGRNHCMINGDTVAIVKTSKGIAESVCNRYTEELANKHPKINLTLLDNPVSNIIYKSIENSDCNKCFKQPFCEQVCFYRKEKMTCFPFKSFLSDLNFYYIRKLASISNFFELNLKYKEKFGEEGEYEGLKKNPDIWKKQIKNVLKLEELK